jgi:hypothetical protein
LFLRHLLAFHTVLFFRLAERFPSVLWLNLAIIYFLCLLCDILSVLRVVLLTFVPNDMTYDYCVDTLCPTLTVIDIRKPNLSILL